MFNVIEGPNGAGKTSLITALREEGYSTLSSPNGTDLARMLRPACRGTEPWTDIDKKIQFMLFSAARYDEYIRLVKDRDDIIFADRWWTSTYIYQCVLQGISVPFLEYTIHPDEKIDLVVLLDADDDVIIRRMEEERDKNPSHGKCRWTQQKSMVMELASLYRNELPSYLESRLIPYEIIDTTNLDKLQVQQTVLDLVGEYRDGNPPLKDCPFCGSESLYDDTENVIYCIGCYSEMRGKTRWHTPDVLAQAWNSRAEKVKKF